MTFRALKHLSRTSPCVRDGIKSPQGKIDGFNPLGSLDGSVLPSVEDTGVGGFIPLNGTTLRTDLISPVSDRIPNLSAYSSPVLSRSLSSVSGKGFVETSVPAVDLKLNTELFFRDSGFKGGFKDSISGILDGKDCVSPEVVKRLKRPGKIVRKDKSAMMVSLNDIILTNATTLVGRFGGRKISVDGFKIWVDGVWIDRISICPDVFILPRGWIAFQVPF